MTKFVRVRDDSAGAEYTTTEAFAKDSHLTITKGDAVDRYGNPLPPKYIINAKKAPTGDSPAADATSEKEAK